MPSAIIKGLTTIAWGGGAALPGFGNAVVVRGTFTPKNSAPIEIEDNDGFAKSLVLLLDGFDAKIECLFDSAISWPAEGATVSVKRPRDGAALNCLLSSIEDTVGRKQEATLSMNITYRPGVALA